MGVEARQRSLADADFSSAKLVLKSGVELTLARCKYKLEVTQSGIVLILHALEAAPPVERGDLFLFPFDSVSSLAMRPAVIERPPLVIAGQPN